MTRHVALMALVGSLAAAMAAQGQTVGATQGMAAQFIDATTGLTLDEAIAQAIDDEPSLGAARAEVEVVRGMRRQAALRPNPSVSFEQQNEPGGMDRQTRVEMQWPLDLFRRGARVAAADRQVDATRYATADRERLLAAEVRVAYGEVAAAVSELALIDELVAVASGQLRLVSARVEQGATPPLERDLLTVELQRLASERALQAGRTERTMIVLKRLLGRSPDTPLRIADTLEQLVARDAGWPLPADTAAAVTGRPDVQEAEAQVQLAEAAIERARREGRLDVSLFGMYMRMEAGFPQQAFTPAGTLTPVRGLFHYVGAGAMVMVPLRNRNQGEVAAAQARRSGDLARLQSATLNARTEIADAQLRDEYARRATGHVAQARTLARQNLEVVIQTYELGRATVFEILTEQRRYLEVEREHISALREGYEAGQALRRALGAVR
jgi:outer membrane protein, heavy metal efflux system